MVNEAGHKKEYDRKRYLSLRDLVKIRTRHYTKLHPESQAIYQAIQRCHNPNAQAYKWYGARGIKCFFTTGKELIDDIGKRPSVKHSLDRINNDGHYEQGNVRWATKKEQCFNSRAIHIPRSRQTGRFICLKQSI